MWEDFRIEWEGGESIAWARCADLVPHCINTCLQRGLLFDIMKEAKRTDTWFVDFVLIWMFNFCWSTDFQSPGSKRHWDSGGPEGTAAISGPLAILWSVFCKGEPHAPTPTFIGWAFHIPAVPNSFSPLKQNKCKRMCLLFTLCQTQIWSLGQWERGTLDSSLETVSAAEQGTGWGT